MALKKGITTSLPLLSSLLPPSSSPLLPSPSSPFLSSFITHTTRTYTTKLEVDPYFYCLKKKAFFASDNAASIHPDILDSLSEVGQQECLGYGFDSFTISTKNYVRDYFGCPEAQVEFTYGGTGGNMCVMSLLRKGDGIAATTCAHIYDDESGGPEFGGNKIYPVTTTHGKMNYDNMVEQFQFALDGGFHRAPVKMISITQPTERGTLYTLDEIKKIGDFCKENDLIFHMDGARIGNALHTLNCSMADMTYKSGVDVVTFGGTKHGLIYGEAIILFTDKVKTDSFSRLQKMLGQKSSKERFIAAQFRAMLSNNYLEKNCGNAVKMALHVKKGIEEIDTKKLIAFHYPVEANVLFVALPPSLLSFLQETFVGVEEWEKDKEGRSVVRVMMSYSTSQEKVEEFLGEVRRWYESQE